MENKDENLKQALIKATNNFTKTHTTTLMGWVIKYDGKGRVVNADPNTRRGQVNLDGVEYYFSCVGWDVTVYKGEPQKENIIFTYDQTPWYIKNADECISKKELKEKCGEYDKHSEIKKIDTVEESGGFRIKGEYGGFGVFDLSTSGCDNLDGIVNNNVDILILEATIKNRKELITLISKLLELVVDTLPNSNYSVGESGEFISEFKIKGFRDDTLISMVVTCDTKLMDGLFSGFILDKLEIDSNIKSADDLVVLIKSLTGTIPCFE